MWLGTVQILLESEYRLQCVKCLLPDIKELWRKEELLNVVPQQKSFKIQKVITRCKMWFQIKVLTFLLYDKLTVGVNFRVWRRCLTLYQHFWNEEERERFLQWFTMFIYKGLFKSAIILRSLCIKYWTHFRPHVLNANRISKALQLKQSAVTSINFAFCKEIRRFCMSFLQWWPVRNIWEHNRIINTSVSKIILQNYIFCWGGPSCVEIFPLSLGWPWY